MIGSFMFLLTFSWSCSNFCLLWMIWWIGLTLNCVLLVRHAHGKSGKAHSGSHHSSTRGSSPSQNPLSSAALVFRLWWLWIKITITTCVEERRFQMLYVFFMFSFIQWKFSKGISPWPQFHCHRTAFIRWGALWPITWLPRSNLLQR